MTSPDGRPLLFQNPEKLKPISGIVYDPQSPAQKKQKSLKRLYLDFETVAKNGILPAEAETRFLRINERSFIGARFPDGSEEYLTINAVSIGDKNIEKIVDPKLLDETPLFLSATCMFSAGSAKGETAQGQSVSLTDPRVTTTITLSESDVIEKISTPDDLTAPEFMVALERQNIFERTNASEIYFEIPITAYMLYGLELKNKGLMSSELYREWCDAVEKRAALLENLEQSLSKATIKVIDPLEKYRSLIRSSTVNASDLCRILRQTDPWWERYLEFNPADNFSDIAVGSYIKTQFDMVSKNKVVVVVDEPKESQLVSRVASLMKDPSFKNNTQGMLVGIYPAGQVAAMRETSECGKDFLVIAEKYRSGATNDANMKLEDILARFAETGNQQIAARAAAYLSANLETPKQKQEPACALA